MIQKQRDKKTMQYKKDEGTKLEKREDILKECRYKEKFTKYIYERASR